VSNFQPYGKQPGQPYERPNQKFRCGRAAAWGKPCSRGPTADGQCGGVDECHPAKDGDRYVCRRPASQGGPCAGGPNPDGTCSQCLPPCVPRVTLRHRRGQLAWLSLAAIFLLIICSFHFGKKDSVFTAAVNPGPLNTKHANFIGDQNCAACHHTHETSTAGWLKAAFSSAHLSAQCLNCHRFNGPENRPHNAEFASHSGLNETRCEMCHTEHHGSDAGITKITDQQCQTCHTKKFTRFDKDHPPFSPEFPHKQRNAIKFDHASHFTKYFPDPKNAEHAPLNCAGCHTVSQPERKIRTLGFDQACAQCHQGGIPMNDLVLLHLPEEVEDISPDDAPALMTWLLNADAGDYGGNVVKLAASLGQKGSSALVSAVTNRTGTAASSSLLAGLSQDVLVRPARIWATRAEGVKKKSGKKAAVESYEPASQKPVSGWYWNENQGWELRYKPAGHADQVVQAWIDLALDVNARAADPKAKKRAESVLKMFTSKSERVGQCSKCHTFTEAADNSGRMQQFAEWRYPERQTHRHTIFPHGLHVNFAACQSCHQLNDRVDVAKQFETMRINTGNQPVSNFLPIKKETCLECHAREKVRQDCLTCHQYHRPPTQAQQSETLLTLVEEKLHASGRNPHILGLPTASKQTAVLPTKETSKPPAPVPAKQETKVAKETVDTEARRLAEAKAQAEAKAKMELEAKRAVEAKVKADALVQAEAVRKADAAKAQLELEAKRTAEEKSKAEALAATKKKADDARIQAEAKRLADEKAAAQAKADMDAKRAAEEKAKALAMLETKKKSDAASKADADARRIAEAKMELEARAKLEMATKQAAEKAKVEALAMAEAKKKADDARAKAAAEAKTKAEMDAKRVADEKARAAALAAVEAKKKADAEAKAKADVEAKQMAEAKAQAEAKAKTTTPPATASVQVEAEPAPKPRTDLHYFGNKACQECHKDEAGVWEKTKHAESFRSFHSQDKTKAIIAAIGGDKNPRKNTTCTQCHYTLEQPDKETTATAKTSVSCESCHGPASEWLALHNVYGGASATKASETPDHKAKRLADTRNAGMIRPDMRYDVAANCLNCHNAMRLDGDTLAKLIGAGHPVNPKFEMIRYSQGGIRHRFYPPDVSVNGEMKPAELARWFVTGQAVMLVAATSGINKTSDAAYKSVQSEHIKTAVQVLSVVKSVPEAAALVAAPTEANARRLVAAIADKDLTGEVGGLLPPKSEYK
jgi:hypothetical protein